MEKKNISICQSAPQGYFLHLSDLAGSSVGDLLDAEGGKLGFLVGELFEEFGRVLLAKFKSLNGLKAEQKKGEFKKCSNTRKKSHKI